MLRKATFILQITFCVYCLDTSPTFLRGWKNVMIEKGKEFLGNELVAMTTQNNQQCLRLCWLYTNCSILTFYPQKQRCRLASELPPSLQTKLVSNKKAVTMDVRMASVDKPRLHGCDHRPCETDELCVPVIDANGHKCLPLGYKNCRDPPPTVSNTDTNMDGMVKVIYSCVEGYVKSGSNDVSTCNIAKGRWSSVDVTCTFKDCGTPPTIEGAITLGNDTFYNARVLYYCYDGHVSQSTSMEITCQANNQWTPPPSPCVLVTCPKAVGVENGNVHVLDRVLNNAPPGVRKADLSLSYGTTAVHSCNEGYQANTAQFRSECQPNGVWQPTSSFNCVPVDCGLPPVFANTWSTYNLTTYQATAVYECVEGYENSLNSTDLICESNRTWSGPEVICQMVDCGEPPLERNATSAFSTTTFTSLVNYTCDPPNFMFPYPVQSRKCQASGNWSDETVDCIECGKPREFDHAKFDIKVIIENIFYIAEYSCDEGYLRTQGKEHLCAPGEDRRWKGNDVMCEEISCGTPPEIPNATVDVNGTSYQSVATYSCQEGFKHAHNSTSLTCGLDSWENNGMEIECERIICGLPPLINNTFYEEDGIQTFNYSSTVQYHCHPGYFLMTATDTKRCQADGWDDVPVRCEQVECGQPTDIPFSEWMLSSTDSGVRALYTCKEGHHLRDSKQNFVRCVDGNWTNSKSVSCLPVDCGSPPIENTTITVNGTLYNNTAVYTCQNGETWTKICQSDGQWSKENITCIEDGCGPPPTFPNAILSVSGTSRQGTVTYSCHSGYKLISPPPRLHCNTTWMGILFEKPCNLIDCGKPPVILHANATYTDTTYSNVVTYECHDKYILSGNATRVCDEDERWSGDDSFSCRPDILCGIPPEVAYASHNIYGDFGAGTVVSYSCHQGFELKDNMSNMTCLQNTSWSREDIECLKLVCGPVPAVENAEYQLKSMKGVIYAQYSCKPAYISIGENNILTCSAENGWTGIFMNCQLVCNNPPQVENASFSLVSNILGAQVTYICNLGYTHWWFESRTCTHEGGWTDERVECVLQECGNPPEFPHSSKSPNYTTTYGSEVLYICDEGYRFTSASTKICTEMGTWSKDWIECTSTQIVCPLPPRENFSTLSHTALGGMMPTATYTCELGYTQFTKTYDKFCRFGKWNSNISPGMKCSPVICTYPPEVINAIMNQNGNTFGSEVSYMCDNSYTMVGTGSKSCLADGTWSSHDTMCLDLKNTPCPSLPPTVENSILKLNVDASQATYSCLPGYVGGGILQCVKGYWISKKLQCVPVDCKIPKEVSDATVTVYNTTINSKAVYECKPDFFQTGPYISVCNASGLWSTPISPCVPTKIQMAKIPCPSLIPQIANADGKLINMPDGKQILYICHSGYATPSNTNSFLALCLPTVGIWSKHENDTCQPAGNCSKIPKMENADHIKLTKNTSDDGTVNFVALYQCHRGFIPRGTTAIDNITEASVTCDTSNGWDQLPVCDIVDCGNLDERVNINVTVNETGGTTYLSQAVLSCRPPLLGKERTSVCQDSGMWSQVDDMTCQRYCDTPPKFPNASLTLVEINAGFHNSTWNIACSEGHQYLGTDHTVTCHLTMSNDRFEETWNGLDSCVQNKWNQPKIPFLTSLRLEKDMYFKSITVCVTASYKVNLSSPVISAKFSDRSKIHVALEIRVDVVAAITSLRRNLTKENNITISEHPFLSSQTLVHMCLRYFIEDSTFSVILNSMPLNTVTHLISKNWAEYFSVDTRGDVSVHTIVMGYSSY